MEKTKCIVCDKEVNWDKVISESAFESIFNKVDMHGEIALSERQQLVYNAKICSANCYKHL